MRGLAIATALTLTTLTFATLHANAQTTSERSSSQQMRTTTTVAQPFNFDLNRAKNLARQAAERANGGLSRYRAEAAMHGPSADTPHVDNGDGSWTFTFRGGAPGSSALTTESVVTVDSNTWTVTVDYNGAVRSGDR